MRTRNHTATIPEIYFFNHISILLCNSGIQTTDERLELISAFERVRPLLRSTFQLQPWFLSLLWKTCLLAELSLGAWVCSEWPVHWQNTDNDDDVQIIYLFWNLYLKLIKLINSSVLQCETPFAQHLYDFCWTFLKSDKWFLVLFYTLYNKIIYFLVESEWVWTQCMIFISQDDTCQPRYYLCTVS